MAPPIPSDIPSRIILTMIFIKKHINLKEGQTLRIIPIGDVHYNTVECDREKFHGLINQSKREIERGDIVYGIGLGDYNDSLSGSERAALVSAKGGFGLHDTTIRAIDLEAARLASTFHRASRGLPFLGLCEGHHFMKFGIADGAYCQKLGAKPGMSTTELLCLIKDCPFLGTLGVIDLTFPQGKRLRLVASHGYGGARTAGARVVKRVRMAEVISPSCDTIFIMGHDDELMVKGAQILDFDVNGNFIAHKVAFVGSGSFQRAYHKGRATGDYVEQLLLPPAQLGVSIIEVNLEKTIKGRWHLSWHVSI